MRKTATKKKKAGETLLFCAKCVKQQRKRRKLAKRYLETHSNSTVDKSNLPEHIDPTAIPTTEVQFRPSISSALENI